MEFRALLSLIASLAGAAQFSDSDSPLRPYHRVSSSPSVTAETRKAAFLGPNRPTDRTRAKLLAQAFFDHHLGGCGGREPEHDAGDLWAFPTRVGDTGAPGPDIRVDKRTGTTAAVGLPTVTDPSITYGTPRFDAKAAALRARDYDRRTRSIDDVLLAAAKIGPRQEIGEYEAWLMTRAYFSVRFGACGGASMPRRGDRLWTAHTVRGAAGLPGPDILIDRRTGDTWAVGSLHVADPKAYAKFASRRS